ncbi:MULTISPECIES: Rpn family recombination-promoting nuclease/putative transposase [unclassified Clostridium]|uniref:Rpn family recombination-promoting nuclease/putative transposase n=1 Tax=unclassified Clostridium TaxID=2614128 RepID=UPI000297E254|nr:MULTISPECIES: Rpn family recombination-promoting nuclease/putative transposase [unclassified Clostridium]EKQ50978.1 MAG: putative transposase or invertase [Clostridium sp. Maddingley MBC34-26]
MDINYDDKMILDPKNDVVFQKIFGSPENEDILISFLNALLERTEKEKIRHIEYVDTKLSDVEAIDDKIGILDVRVVTEKGIHINVEIQLINRYNMINRTLFYWSRLYSNQIKKGENYKNLNKTITINILNFNYIESKKYHTTYHLWEDEEKTKLTDILEIHFIELPKYLNEQPELNNSLNKWLAFLTKPEKRIMEVVEMGEPEIRKAITVLDMLSRDPETVRLAELRMKKILDEKSMIEGAKEEGIKEATIKNAKNFLSMGLDVDIVAKGTGLSIEEVLKIKEELN